MSSSLLLTAGGFSGHEELWMADGAAAHCEALCEEFFNNKG
jgi:hypothetical protein